MENKVKSILKKDDQIITYSEDFNYPASTIAAEKLINYGFINVLVYKGGWKDWKDAKYPVEKK